MSPASFVHPRATRELLLGNARVAYEFTRGKRRTIGFVVGAEGLSVRAPRWVALRDVDAAVKEKADWILRKLSETQQRHARLEATRIEWKDGVSFPFLGEPVVVRLDPHHAFDGIGAMLDAGSGDAPHTLRLALANNANPAQIRDAAQAWLMRQARRVFTERLDHFAPRLGVAWRKLALSNASTRWGSAQRRRNDPAALAAGALQDVGDRLRGGARTEPPARDGPQPALLGNGGERAAGLRLAAAAAQGAAGSEVVSRTSFSARA